VKLLEGRPDLGGALKLLADPTRLRILGLLDREELSVGDLSRALDLAQSRVSNHLRLLREAGLLLERHVGTSTFLRLDTPRNGARLAGLPGRLWEVVRSELDQLPGAIDRALQGDRPALINIAVDFTPHPMDFLWPNIILDGFQFPEVQKSKLRAVA